MLKEEKITKKIAKLAKIELSDSEIQEYTKDLFNILKWINELKKVDVSKVEPLTCINDSKLFERKDIEFKKKIEKKEILKNAPNKTEDYFSVPKVIE